MIDSESDSIILFYLLKILDTTFSWNFVRTIKNMLQPQIPQKWKYLPFIGVLSWGSPATMRTNSPERVDNESEISP